MLDNSVKHLFHDWNTTFHSLFNAANLRFKHVTFQHPPPAYRIRFFTLPYLIYHSICDFVKEKSPQGRALRTYVRQESLSGLMTNLPKVANVSFPSPFP